jgi:hypothetical protein
MRYTFIKGANIPEDVKVGDSHTWMQTRPHVGGYPGRSGGPPKEITGSVVAIDGIYVRVEAERMEAGR